MPPYLEEVVRITTECDESPTRLCRQDLGRMDGGDRSIDLAGFDGRERLNPLISNASTRGT